ncbi:MAG: hypothetical protein QNJ54_31685 [Prochloraceae cyanobacterium]|nr:hypothetical protein [Prochloraceae cyanobacterium]
MINNFNIELAKQLVESGEDFPVDLDLLWQWCGFDSKFDAERKILYQIDPQKEYRILNDTPSPKCMLSVGGARKLAFLNYQNKKAQDFIRILDEVVSDYFMPIAFLTAIEEQLKFPEIYGDLN